MDLRSCNTSGCHLCLLFLVIMVLPFSACAQKKETTEPLIGNKAFELTLRSLLDYSVPILSVEELHNDYDRFILLDAREEKEYRVSHLPGALHIGYDSLDWDLIRSLPKQDTLLLYCSVGYRSEKAAEKLALEGYTVVNLYGSIFEWVNRGYPVVDSTGKEVKRVHGYNKMWSLFIRNKKLEVEY